MIWYILYPLRGTTEPPKLSPNHPIRRAFQLHGTATAQHWLLSILLTAVLSVLLCYPVLFHADNPAAAGLRNLPHHVWTSATEFEGNKTADVEMRQVWVHGDYMKAIDLRVLQQALHVQNALIARGFGNDPISSLSPAAKMRASPNECIPDTLDPSWGFHSPLMYWNCSQLLLDTDSDLLSTINSHSAQQSFLGFTLRPSSVFAGKAFRAGKLQAADALVITLFDRTQSTLRNIWEARSEKLAKTISPDWALYPKDGHIVRSRLYEFRFQPMTVYDDLTLAIIYCFSAAYVLYRLGRIRAIKSKTGLVVTIVFKMTASVLASFTVCSFLEINLSRIPREVFPFTVMVFGLGNIFRLINEVLATPPEMPPVQRISNAIGEVGHLSLAVAVQNLVVLYLLSRLVTPWVAQFCAFAAVTLVFDFVFHITFFLAVLSVEVQRMELQDSLARVDPAQPPPKNLKQERPSWLEALRQGRLPFSTRLAGSAAIVSFILALNWHFFDSTSQAFSLRRLRDKWLARGALDTPAWSPPPINQARTPAEWLRMQDHNTAKELITFIKPNAYSFVARVYDPLLVVLNGADGRKATYKPESIFEIVRRLAHEHAFPAAILVVLAIGSITLYLNYLLWNGAPDDSEDGASSEELFSVKSLSMPNSLDVASLVSCGSGHLASISLDRSVSIWLYERGKRYMHMSLPIANMKPKLWPIVASTIDDGGSMFALCTDGGQVAIWSLSSQRWISFQTIELDGHSPLLFTFVPACKAGQATQSLVTFTLDGNLTEIDIRTKKKRVLRISSRTVTCASLCTSTKDGTKVIFANKAREVHIYSLDDPQPTPSILNLSPETLLSTDAKPSKIKSIYIVSSLRLLFLLRSSAVQVVDLQSQTLIHTFQIQVSDIKPNSFRVIHSARRTCSCGSLAAHSISLIYTELQTQYLVMQRFSLEEDSVDSSGSLICFAPPSSPSSFSPPAFMGGSSPDQLKLLKKRKPTCRGLDKAMETIFSVHPAGIWETTYSQSVIGIRKCPSTPTPSSTTSGADVSVSAGYLPSSLGKALRVRLKARGNGGTENEKVRDRDGDYREVEERKASSSSFFQQQLQMQDAYEESVDWETWSLDANGEFLSRPLLPSHLHPDNNQSFGSVGAETIGDGLENQQLFVANPGPITRLGKRSVAVGFGNTVKVITLGREWFEGGVGEWTREGIGGEMSGVLKASGRGRRGAGRKMM